MKKIDYQAPEMEVIKLEMQADTLQIVTTSGEGQEFGGEGSADDQP